MRKKGNYQTHKSTFEQIKGYMESLSTAAEEFDSVKEIQAFKTTTSDDTVATVAAEGNALQGNFNMSVTQLATNERRYSDPISSNTATGLFGTGTLTIQQGSDTSFDVTVDGSTRHLRPWSTTSTRQMVASELACAFRWDQLSSTADQREDWGRE